MAVVAAAEREPSLFGHPKGFTFLLGTETGWAFAYFGLQATLTLYLTQVVIRAGHVFGLLEYRRAVTYAFGPLSPLAFASATYGITMGTMFALPVFGGFVADRLIGQKRAVLIGLTFLVAGYLLLVFEQTFLIALVALIVGTGFLKTSLVGQIGRAYKVDDPRREQAFGLYLIALNLGSMITPLISGTICERLGWHAGFLTMAVGMTLGGGFYVAGMRYIPDDLVRIPRAAAKDEPGRKGNPAVLAALILVLVFDGIWSGTYNQAFNIFPVWASNHVQRTIGGFLMPVTWFSTLDGILTIGGTAVAIKFWGLQARRGSAPNDLNRITFGFLLAVCAFGTLAFAASLATTSKAPLALIFAFFLLIDFSIPWVDTSTLALVSRRAPAELMSTMIGLYYLAVGGGNFFTGWLGGFADTLEPTIFWSMHGAIDGAILAFLLVFGVVLKRVIGERFGRQQDLLPES
jgi:POT family proton-dependent oligopeptide transporter